MTVKTVGVFLATEDVPRLVAWYKALGVPLQEGDYCTLGGTTPVDAGVFSIQGAKAPLPKAPAGDITAEPYGLRRATLNFRVEDLSNTILGLQKRGTKVAGPSDVGYGVFAWCHDPDGNVVELWEAGAPPT